LGHDSLRRAHSDRDRSDRNAPGIRTASRGEVNRIRRRLHPGQDARDRLPRRAFWGQAVDLATVHDEKVLPDKEQQAWRKLWAAALREKLESKKEGQ
jgi:hypothetical protein